jgi:hypothetical protein
MNRERIQFIIDNLAENLEVEAKNWLGGLKSNEMRAKLAKELIALANHGGGLVFIGFDDENDLAEISPQTGELEAYTQDNIASIVLKYAEPPFQCEIELVQKTSSEIVHPVIIVPGQHRTPVYAKSGSPDQSSLLTSHIYVRRPGGSSEAARTQDDWEKLLERLVKARQDELISAIRTVINPPTVERSKRVSLADWHNESYSEWKNLTNALPADSTHRLSKGHWAFSFQISDFNSQSLAILNQYLRNEVPKLTGWPVFTYLHQPERTPNARGDVIQAWLADTSHADAKHSDFWRIDRSGRGFILRPMQEDYNGFGQDRMSGPLFDWSLPVWRTAELFKFVEHFGKRFAGSEAEFDAMVRYHGTRGRSLYNRDWSWNLDGGTASSDPIENGFSGRISTIGSNLPEIVQQLMQPVYEQFQFAELPTAYVVEQINRLLRRN